MKLSYTYDEYTQRYVIATPQHKLTVEWQEIDRLAATLDGSLGTSLTEVIFAYWCRATEPAVAGGR